MASGAAYDATIGGTAVRGSIPAPTTIAVAAAANNAAGGVGGVAQSLSATAAANDATVAIT